MAITKEMNGLRKWGARERKGEVGELGMRKGEDVQDSSFDVAQCGIQCHAQPEVTLIYNHPHARAQQQRVPASKSSMKENKSKGRQKKR